MTNTTTAALAASYRASNREQSERDKLLLMIHLINEEIQVVLSDEQAQTIEDLRAVIDGWANQMIDQLEWLGPRKQE